MYLGPEVEEIELEDDLKEITPEEMAAASANSQPTKSRRPLMDLWAAIGFKRWLATAPPEQAYAAIEEMAGRPLTDTQISAFVGRFTRSSSRDAALPAPALVRAGRSTATDNAAADSRNAGKPYIAGTISRDNL